MSERPVRPLTRVPKGALSAADTCAQDDPHDCATMTKEPTLEEQELLADTRRRAAAAEAPPRAAASSSCVNLGFVAAVGAMFVLPSPQALESRGGRPLGGRHVRWPSGCQFETPFGFTVASQLAFVPMLFCDAAGLRAARGGRGADRRAAAARRRRRAAPPDQAAPLPGQRVVRRRPRARLRRRRRPPRRRRAGAPRWRRWLAQFAGDFRGRVLSRWSHAGRSLRQQLRDCAWVYLIDAALSVVALVVAEELHAAPYAVLAVAPAAGAAADVRQRAQRAAGQAARAQRDLSRDRAAPG